MEDQPRPSGITRGLAFSQRQRSDSRGETTKYEPKSHEPHARVWVVTSQDGADVEDLRFEIASPKEQEEGSAKAENGCHGK